MGKGFREKLAERQKIAKTLVCVGLDPLGEKIPKRFSRIGGTVASMVEEWMRNIIKSTAEYASMFKPQIAHWEAIPDGIEALKKVIKYIHSSFPDIPVFVDCKRGDIARTQKQYGIATFNILGADGMNFNPYMGKDCMGALVSEETRGKALVGLCYTSNPDAREVQDVLLANDSPFWAQHCAKEIRYWQFIASRTLAWAEELSVVADAGLVMAAAYEKPKNSGNIYSDHLVSCRQIVGDKLWFLIPGVGAQGGFIAETVRAAYVGPGSIAINSSSEINFASSGEDYAEAAGIKARELRDKINEAISAYESLL